MKKFGLILGVLLLIATTAFAQFGAGVVLSGLDVGPLVTYQLGPITLQGVVSLTNVSFANPSADIVLLDPEGVVVFEGSSDMGEATLSVGGAGFNVGVRCLYDVVSTKESAFYLGAGLNLPVFRAGVSFADPETELLKFDGNVTLVALEPLVLFGTKLRVAPKVTLFAEAGYALAFLLPVKATGKIYSYDIVEETWVEEGSGSFTVTTNATYGRTFASFGITYSF
jgi:hypothetical protein